MADTDIYQSPLITRYASSEMLQNFSDDKKFRTWRLLWIALARAEKELGLDITDEQIDELVSQKDNIDYDLAKENEKKLRHDVMAHVHTYGAVCPLAAGIIHLGATSCYVGDNTDLILMRDAFVLIRKKVLSVMRNLSEFADKYKDLPTLGFTHFQPAQLTTVGKRACLWLHDLLLDVEEIDFFLDTLKFLGSKGTTGTQASFVELFDGDASKITRMERLIAEEFGFREVYPVSGQTYSRKVDSRFLRILSSVSSSCAKFSNDMRLLQHLKEIEEPYEKNQIGSSAMAYKRNPMRAERMAGLCRYITTVSQNGDLTQAGQWFERTLDDSANKRLSVPEAALALDGVLNLYLNITAGLVLYPKVIQKHIQAELPFMTTENIIMNAVKKGGDRQDLHEHIRLHSVAAAGRVKQEGAENNLLELISADPIFRTSEEEIRAVMKPENYTGLASEQTESFLTEHIYPLIKDAEFVRAEINV
ncbi:adenylosuccinate lyase [Clostridia bacterium]|nr:adenylosuccinate lyase [Clostridia bacterium]